MPLTVGWNRDNPGAPSSVDFWWSSYCICSAAWSPDHSRLAIFRDRALEVWDENSGSVIATKPLYAARMVDWNQDGDTGDTAVSISWINNIRDSDTNFVLEELVPHHDWSNIQYYFIESPYFQKSAPSAFCSA